MYYHQITEEQWPSLAPYLDTCVIPVVSLESEDHCWEMKARIGLLKGMQEAVERTFSGRVVIFPEYNDFKGSELGGNDVLQHVITGIKRRGFRYIILLCNQKLDFGDSEGEEGMILFCADNEQLTDENISHMRHQIIQLWETSKGTDSWNKNSATSHS